MCTSTDKISINSCKCVSEMQIKDRLRKYTLEADQLTNEILEIDCRRGQIQERLIQLMGSIEALNSLLQALQEIKEEQSD